jgi:hypothetical protein
MLGEQVRMAQRVAEEGPAGLVQVLAVDEDQHPGGWIGRERRDGRVRHLGSQADGGDKKPRSSNGKPGPVKLHTVIALVGQVLQSTVTVPQRCGHGSGDDHPGSEM